jgi:hypothetical protein
MLGRLTWVVGFGAGYVLGARAGRERYDQIAGRAQALWSDPRVQEKAGHAQQVVRQKADRAQQLVMRNGSDESSVNGADSESRPGSWPATDSGPTGDSAGSGSPISPGTGSGTS